MSNFSLKIGGVPYQCARVGAGEVDPEDPKKWGEFDGAKHSIRYVGDNSPERVLRTFLHEVCHAIAYEYSIRELTGKSEENPIDQLAHGLAEVLEGLGVELPI